MKRILYAYVAAFVFVLYAPLVTLGAYSFASDRVQVFPPSGLSTEWIKSAIERRTEFVEGLRNSIFLGFLVSIVGTLLGGCAAWLIRQKPDHRRLLFIVICIPALVPPLLAAVAWLAASQLWGGANGPLPVLLGHICLVLPFTMAIIAASFQQISIERELAARNLGADWKLVLADVFWPPLRPAVIAALVVAFLISWDEFVLAWFNGGFFKTLPTVIYGKLGSAFDPSLNFVTFLSTVISGFILTIAAYFLSQSVSNSGGSK